MSIRFTRVQYTSFFLVLLSLCLTIGSESFIYAEVLDNDAATDVSAKLESTSGSGVSGYLWLMIRMILALGFVALVCYASLRWGLKHLLSDQQKDASKMEVLSRVSLEPKRSLFMVRVESRVFLLGSSEAGLNTIAELTEAEKDLTKPKETNGRHSTMNVPVVPLRPPPESKSKKFTQHLESDHRK